MAQSVPAPSTRVAHSQGRGAASQEEAERQTAGDQVASKAAMEGPMEKGDEAEEQDEEEDNNNSRSGNKSSSSSGEQSKDKESMKPPTRSKGATKR